MPANPERRTLIMDTAIDIVAEAGAGGLTHRIVDQRADLPPGTTSNFFRTRLALLQATAERVAELHWRQVAEIRARLGESTGRAGLAALLGTMLDDPGKITLARFELFLEGNRHPELRPILADIYAAAMESATAVLRSAGVPAPPERVRLFSKLLNGLAFDQLTTPAPALSQVEATELVERVLDLMFEPG